MSRILLVLLFLLFMLPCSAENLYFQGSVTFNWDTVSQEEREEDVLAIRNCIFGDTVEKKRQDDFKTRYKDFLKDRDYKNHYLAASAGYKEYKEFNISAMYLKRMSTLYMYALQPKNDLMTIYYYDAMGSLRYVDNIKGSYPNFPYYTEQYRRNGSMVGISYFTSRDTQYIFKSNGDFKGVSNKDKFYNLKGKVIMHRSNY